MPNCPLPAANDHIAGLSICLSVYWLPEFSRNFITFFKYSQCPWRQKVAVLYSHCLYTFLGRQLRTDSITNCCRQSMVNPRVKIITLPFQRRRRWYLLLRCSSISRRRHWMQWRPVKQRRTNLHRVTHQLIVASVWFQDFADKISIIRLHVVVR